MTLRLNGSSSGYTEIDAPAAAGSNTITLPTSNGSANQFLQNGSTAGTLEFGSLVSSDMPTGSILQVVQATYSTETTVSTTSFTDTGLSGSITPSSTSSKVLVIINQPINLRRSNTSQGAGLNILRGSTTIYSSPSDGTGPFLFYNENGSGGINHYTVASLMFLDSPSTTSATTYKTQSRPYLTSDSGNVRFQASSYVSVITLMEVAA